MDVVLTHPPTAIVSKYPSSLIINSNDLYRYFAHKCFRVLDLLRDKDTFDGPLFYKICSSVNFKIVPASKPDKKLVYAFIANQ